MSNEFTFIGVIVGGSFLAYYMLKDQTIATVVPYLGAGAFVGGIVWPSIKAEKLTYTANSALLGTVGGGVTYYIVEGANNGYGMKTMNPVWKRVRSHHDL